MKDGSGRRTRIKFCGMCREEDVQHAVRLGVDAIGFVHVDGSPRKIGLERAAALRRGLPPFVACVSLMRNPLRADVETLVNMLNPDLIQFHGEESPSFCTSFGRPYIKAIAMGGGKRGMTLMEVHPNASALLLDGHLPGGMGGQGKPFEWGHARFEALRPIIVAGGLDESNVGDVIRMLNPYAVDVSSGIEDQTTSAPSGAKDWQKMEAFVDAVRRADAAEGKN